MARREKTRRDDKERQISRDVSEIVMRKTKQGTASKERQMQLRDKQRYVTRKTNMKE